MIRALIIEDTPLARRGIRMFLQQERDVEVVGEAVDGPDAVAKIRTLRPDLLFLDIHMPGFGGFEVLEQVKDLRIGAVIFITAHSNHALEAFRNDAVSYLLKPIEPKRFSAAVARARQLLRPDRGAAAGDAGERSDPDVDEVEGVVAAQLGTDRTLSRILIRQDERYLLLKIEEIRWVEAAAEYSRLHTTRGDWLVRIPISDLAGRLPASQFARIHRSTIVNLDQIREIHPRSHGDCDVVLQDSTELRLTRSYRSNIFRDL